MKPVLITLLMILSCVAGADTVTIDLDSLVGDYDSGFIDPSEAPRIRFQPFTIPADVNALESLQLVMSGTNIDGWQICEFDLGGGVVIRDTTSIVTQMRLVLTAPPLGEDCFFGFVNLLSSSVTDASGPVTSCNVGEPLDPDLLLNTTVQAQLEVNFSPGCEVWLDALVVLSDVRLLLQVETVAAESRSWGEIKALYR